MMEQDLIAVRIKDGIFAGNVVAAEDREFLGMNKITHVINCAGGEVADYFAGDPELRYLSFPWKDTAGPVCTTVLFDTADGNIKRAIQFIDEALEGGSCVLVHSFYGVSRAPALIAAYFIVKYGWKLESALSFLEMAHPDVSIKPHFLRQLRLFAKSHTVEHDIFDKAVDDSHFGLDNDQWMLRNTLLNGLAFEEQQTSELYALCSKSVDVGAPLGKPKRRGHLVFVDTQKGTTVESAATTPVVNVKPVQHIDPNAAPGAPQFMGSQGATVIRSGRRSPSILSRSVSPCPYRLESDTRACPKGRQDLPLRESEKEKNERELQEKEKEREKEKEKQSRRVASAANEPQVVLRAPALQSATSAPKPVVRTNSARSIGTANSESEKKTQSPRRGTQSTRTSTDLKRLSPPSGQSVPSRSPFATLTSTHKYRNGSPLPLKGTKKKAGAGRSKASSPHSSPARSAASRDGASDAPASTQELGSAAVVRGSASVVSSAARPTSTGYKGIAPQRAGVRKASVGADARDNAVPGSISPGLRSSSAKARSGSAKGRSGSAKGRTSSPSGASGTGRKVARSGSADGKSKVRTTSRPSSATATTNSSFSEKPTISRPTASSSAHNTPSSTGDSGAAAGGVIRRQPATGITSRRQP